MYKRVEYRLPYTDENTRRCSTCRIKMVGGPQVKLTTDTRQTFWLCPRCDPGPPRKGCKPRMIGGG